MLGGDIGGSTVSEREPDNVVDFFLFGVDVEVAAVGDARR
jgi:hypothetical protein